MLDSINEDDKETARRVLLWLALSKSAMSIQELAEAVKIEPRQFEVNKDDFLLDPKALFGICRSMIIERSDDKVRLAHYSVQQFLFSENAKDFRVHTIEGNAEIASVCLTYMLQDDLQRGPHERNHLLRHFDAADSHFPFLRFASVNWSKHVQDEKAKRLVKDLILDFLLPKQSQPSIAWQEVLLGHIEPNLDFSVPVTIFAIAHFNLPFTLRGIVRSRDLDIDQVMERRLRGYSPLAIAVEKNHLKVAEILLEVGANPNGGQNYGGSLLSRSYYSVEMTRLLLNYGADFGNNPSAFGPNLIGVFATSSGVELAELYLGHNVYPTSLFEKVLHYVYYIHPDSLEGMKFLIDIGMEVPLKAVLTLIVRHFYHPASLETLTSLLQQNLHTREDLQPALSEAAGRGKNEFIDILLRYGADINEQDNLDPPRLISFSTGSSKELFETQKGEATLPGGYRYKIHGPPLIVAASNLRKDTVVLLSLGADPNVRGDNEIIPLLAGLSKGCSLNCPDSRGSIVEMVRTLLRHGADVNLKGEGGETALIRVTCRENWQLVDNNCDEEIVDALLDVRADHDPQLETEQSKDYFGALLTPLIGAAERGSERMVRTFLSRNVNFNQSLQDTHGYGTPLIAACRNNHPKVVKLLLAYGADPNIHGGDAFSALQAAAGCFDLYMYRNSCKVPEGTPNEIATALLRQKKDAEEVFQSLIIAGADPCVQGGRYGTVLTAACHAGNLFAVKKLLELNVNVNVFNDVEMEYGHRYYYKQTALMSALKENHHEIVRQLILCGADTSIGVPVYAAVNSSTRDPEIINFLLQHGAEVDATPLCSRETALCRAVDVEAFIDIIRILLEAGADPNTTGSTSPPRTYPLDAATRKHNWECGALLEEFGAKSGSADTE